MADLATRMRTMSAIFRCTTLPSTIDDLAVDAAVGDHPVALLEVLRPAAPAPSGACASVRGAGNRRCRRSGRSAGTESADWLRRRPGRARLGWAASGSRRFLARSHREPPPRRSTGGAGLVRGRSSVGMVCGRRGLRRPLRRRPGDGRREAHCASSPTSRACLELRHEVKVNAQVVQRREDRAGELAGAHQMVQEGARLTRGRPGSRTPGRAAAGRPGMRRS